MPTDLAVRIRARSIVAERARSMIALVEDRHPGKLSELRLHAVSELNIWGEVQVVAMSIGSPAARCNLAGVYLDQFDPPRIGISSGSTIRRAAFTALHEYGHHLQRTDELLIDGLIEQSDYGRVLEEMTCDTFAAAILLPEDEVKVNLGDTTPTALQVVRLWESHSASRAAVCVSASKRLAGPGHVLILDDTGTVVFSASHGEFPLRAGGDQSQTEIFKAIQRRLGATSPTNCVTRFAYRAPYRGPELYAQAVDMGGYWVVVAITDNAPWERISLSSRAPIVAMSGLWHTCEHCQWVYKQGSERCEICGVQKCPECNGCDCPSRVAERKCTECNLIKPAHFFTGSSMVCIDCC